jgi:crossover junction endodeoxyribonuclease RusA
MIEIDGKMFGVVMSEAEHVILTLPIPPSANRYWRHVGHKVLVSQEAKEYKQIVGLFASEIEPLKKGVNAAVSFSVYRPRKSGDLDNYTKVMLDALKGVLYDDDEQVIEIHAKRFDDKENPRVVFEAWRA